MSNLTLSTDNENKDLVTTGFFKLWTHDIASGRSTLCIDKKNTIMNSGASLLAKALGGVPNTQISHMYLGYANAATDPETTPSDYIIDPADSVFPATANCGYVRVPLTYPASFTTSDVTTYPLATKANIAVFTVLVNDLASYQVGALVDLTNSTSKFFEAALVAALNSSNDSQDIVMARVSFNTTRVTYDNTQGLNVTWGIKFTA